MKSKCCLSDVKDDYILFSQYAEMIQRGGFLGLVSRVEVTQE